MARKAIVLLLVLVLAVVPVIAGCSGDTSGPGPGDNGPVQPGPDQPGPDQPGPTDNSPTRPGPVQPGPTEPAKPAGPEFPLGRFGTVFDDANANGVRDPGEPGLQGVLVSNGIACRSTGADGVYNLPSDNSLVFMTVPGDRASTGPWYAAPGTDNIDFGLRPAPEKAGAAGDSGFTFVQITDLHACQAQAAALSTLAAELNSLSPAFVVATGDLIADGNEATVDTANGWFDVYENFTAQLGMPVCQAVGNHDVVGTSRADAAAGPGYGKEIFLGRFGPAYYSFDWGRHHCIVLDPNGMEVGKQVYRISPSQVRWLADDLSYRKEAPLLVFYHEPSVSWANRSAVMDLFAGRDVNLFCGHLHQGVTLECGAGGQAIPEHITAAVCGEWWRGPNPDGRPQGYRLVSVQGNVVDSLFMGTGDNRTVDFGLSPVVSGPVDLAVKLHSRSGPVTGVTCLVDDNQTLAVSLEERGPWAVAAASWDASSLPEGYHHLTLRGADGAGAFEERFDFKKSAAGAVSVSDLAAHREVFLGAYVPVEGQFGLMICGPLSLGGIKVPAGSAFLLLRDGSDALMVVAGEVFSPPLPGAFLSTGASVVVRLVLVRVTMAQIMSTGEWDSYYPLVSGFLGLIPESAREPPGVSSVTDLTAVWGGRWLSAADFAVKAGPA